MKLSNAQKVDYENMTYFDSAEGAQISYQRAMQELKKHGMYNSQGVAEFELAFGKKDSYDAQAILRWLGY